MTERQLQFRVGFFTLISLSIGAALVVQFGELRRLWEPTYQIDVSFETAPGVYPDTPILSNGINIGAVKEVRLEDVGVTVVMNLREEHRLHADAIVSLSRGLLGDTSLDVVRGRQPAMLEPGSKIVGQPYVDPLEVVQRVEERLGSAVESFEDTSKEWRAVGSNLNGIMVTNRGRIDQVVERAADSLAEFSSTMQTLARTADQAGALVGDPEIQTNLRRALVGLPTMVEDTRAAVAAVRAAVQKADENLTNMAAATAPLADRSASIVSRLDATLANLYSLTSEINEFSKVLNAEDGTLRQLATDPSLYRNLNRSAESVTVLLANLEPVLRDIRVFSDKIARHPELIGVGGALSGSDGSKPVVPASAERPASPIGIRR